MLGAEGRLEMTPVIRTQNLTKIYPVRGSETGVRALVDVDLEIAAGETVGIVGESGCGKSTLAKVLVGLEKASSGTYELLGKDVTNLKPSEFRKHRTDIQMVFQDPFGSLNPRQRVGATLEEVLVVHNIAKSSTERKRRVLELLDLVGLRDTFADRLPGQLSGGQRQRVGIARALAVEPSILVLDESISALDVSIQAAVMNLLVKLRDELELTYLFIAHDLSMVRHVSDRIAVMYLGRIVELGNWRSVSDDPLHPYSIALQHAIPVPDPTLETGEIETPISGEIPNPANPPHGCTFHPRCPEVQTICRDVSPPLEPAAGRRVACHVVQQRLQSAGVAPDR